MARAGEFATFTWVAWLNGSRLLEPLSVHRSGEPLEHPG